MDDTATATGTTETAGTTETETETETETAGTTIEDGRIRETTGVSEEAIEVVGTTAAIEVVADDSVAVDTVAAAAVDTVTEATEVAEAAG